MKHEKLKQAKQKGWAEALFAIYGVEIGYAHCFPPYSKSEVAWDRNDPPDKQLFHAFLTLPEATRHKVERFEECEMVLYVLWRTEPSTEEMESANVHPRKAAWHTVRHVRHATIPTANKGGAK